MRKPAGIIIPAGSVRPAESQDMMRNGICLPQEKPDQLLVDGPVGLVPHRQVQPGFFVYNALDVGKGLKPGFAVVGPHAALPEASEGHGVGGQVDDHVVDAPAAKAASGHHLPGQGTVLREEVEGQGVGTGFYLRQGLVQTAVGSMRRASGSVPPP